ncbi:Stf0 sulfotransferase family protein [Kineosporia rhizophila]|uniref:Stf0 family sulfotransferase n=1 Tax=Kineosporia TaxID=49184 RepID=UPI001E419844|nr:MULTISPECIES: Stf0 family sulfotransferase [Kineosporia]MCE0539528.1 Stf0 sulfotransferase family protein [Kineosporia rhizophila]
MCVDAYFVCATPRTGSSLLLGLLASSGCAGRPQAYFRAPDEALWAERWQLPRTGYPYADFVTAALAAGRTANGVFGAKLMWGTIGELTARLADAYPDAEGAATTAGDLAVLRRAFGRVGFVHLSRRDVLAQAVSWVRAEQTQQWYAGGDGEISGQISNQPTGARPTFDANAIEHHLHLIQEHQQGWEDWFSANGVSPHRVTYEELTADLTGTTTRVLQALGLEAPAQPPVARHQRQGDHVNQEWITRYRAHAHAEAQTRASAEDGAQDAPDFRGEHEKP